VALLNDLDFDGLLWQRALPFTRAGSWSAQLPE
jgi:hypothetical protein